MDEPERRVVHRFGTASLFSSIEASFVLFLSPFYEQKNAKKNVLNLCDIDGKYGKILDFRIGPEIGLIRCSKDDKLCNLP